jgi:cytochrome c
MHSLEFNKISFAVLSALLFLMGIGMFSDMVFSTHKPAKPGYALPDNSGAATAPAAAAPAAPAVPVAELLAKADVKRGEALFGQQCRSCHTVDKGGKSGIGPNLYGVVERPIASSQGFSYSPALAEKAKTDKTWSFEHLQSFITAPAGYARGTKMAYAGVKDPARLGDLLAYLNTISDSPAALPK